jgi:cold shock CspA family protein
VADGVPPLGANGLPVARGAVAALDVDTISSGASDEDVFFSFTAIPGEGYRTPRPGTPVSFELVENERGPTARNVRRERPNHERSS